MNRPVAHLSASPLELILRAHESVTGQRERRSGKSFRISCAACGTASPKVSITEAANGSILLHAFCGHSPQQVLEALGLTLASLFPLRDLRTMTPAERSQLRQLSLVTRWRAAIEVLRHEAWVLLVAANKLGDGEELTQEERARVRTAALKVFDAEEVLNAR